MFFNNKKEPVSGSSVKRIKNMQTPALKSWFDNTVMSLGSAYDQWRFHEGSHKEVSDHIHILDEMWKELLARTDHEQ